jgi:RNA polymerase-interacting CarD/CdnL/TRCF family regulator
MEKEIPSSKSYPTEFLPGSRVVYGTHGKCIVQGIELKSIAGEATLFYKLQKEKIFPAKIRPTDPAILVPVLNSKKMGLRTLASSESATKAWELLSGREFFFPLQQAWASSRAQIEKSIIADGILGLAKAVSYLTVYSKRQSILESEVSRLHEQCFKQLARELSEVTGEPQKDVEARIQKVTRSKHLPDH